MINGKVIYNTFIHIYRRAAPSQGKYRSNHSNYAYKQSLTKSSIIYYFVSVTLIVHTFVWPLAAFTKYL